MAARPWYRRQPRVVVVLDHLRVAGVGAEAGSAGARSPVEPSICREYATGITGFVTAGGPSADLHLLHLRDTASGHDGCLRRAVSVVPISISADRAAVSGAMAKAVRTRRPTASEAQSRLFVTNLFASLALHLVALTAVWCIPAPTRPTIVSVRIAAVSESSAAAAAADFEVVDLAAPTEVVEVEPPPAGEVVASEPPAEVEPPEAAVVPLDLRPAEWTRAAADPWVAADALWRVRRAASAESPPVAPQPVAALPTVPSVPLAKVLSPLPGCNPAPEYPALARRRGIEGVVEIRVRVDAAGFVIERSIVVSSGSRLLDAAALQAVAKWRFEHGPGEAQVPFRFDLMQSSPATR